MNWNLFITITSVWITAGIICILVLMHCGQRVKENMEEVNVMKATGLVRRIDDLGRIVIPKEIRRQLGIKESEPMELYIDTDDRDIILRKCEVSLEEHLDSFNDLVQEYGDRNHEQLSEIRKHIREIKQLLKEEKQEEEI